MNLYYLTDCFLVNICLIYLFFINLKNNIVIDISPGRSTYVYIEKDIQ